VKADILVVEDVAELAELVTLYLEKEGMTVRRSETAEGALELMGLWNPDLVILDINLPGMDGFEFLHRFRKQCDAPVLVVSARDAEEDIISGLGYGADEYMTKPFSPRVLVARVRAMLRRKQDASESLSEDQLTFGPYVLDTQTCVLMRGRERVSLSAREYAVLAYLAENPGKPLSPEKIYSDVWKNAYGDITAVGVYIQRIRKKIEEDPGNPRYIVTEFGMGYRFIQTPEEEGR
jgi:two-component system response regulator RegX3